MLCVISSTLRTSRTHFPIPRKLQPLSILYYAHHILWDKLKCHAKEVVLSIHYSHICSPLLVADISGAADCTCTLRARCSHLLHPTKGNAPSPSSAPPPPIPLPTPPSQESLQHFKQSLQPPPPLPSHPAGSITIHVRLFHLP